MKDVARILIIYACETLYCGSTGFCASFSRVYRHIFSKLLDAVRGILGRVNYINLRRVSLCIRGNVMEELTR